MRDRSTHFARLCEVRLFFEDEDEDLLVLRRPRHERVDHARGHGLPATHRAVPLHPPRLEPHQRRDLADITDPGSRLAPGRALESRPAQSV